MVRHVYVHVPFCARRCSYCDFAIAVRRNTPVDEYLRGLRAELARATPSSIDTLYLGGGTPSRLGGDGVRRLLEVISERYTRTDDAEVTLEANPEDVTPDAARAWLDAGVNRLSLGMQSFDDKVLAWMHRTHDAATARHAFEIARDAGFANVSLDLIFALPESLRRDWRGDIERAFALEPDHISLYGLTIEPATPLARWRDRGTLTETSDERYESEYLLAHELLAAAGYEHYEVSNFSRPGRASRHNSAYWTLARYTGHGPSAHSFDGATRHWNEPVYTRWLDRVHSGVDPTEDREVLSDDQRELERVYLDLRTTRGCDVAPDHSEEIARWVEAGWARIDSRRVLLTPSGWLRLDTLTTVLTGIGSPCKV